jgi:hypothetical protein
VDRRTSYSGEEMTQYAVPPQQTQPAPPFPSLWLHPIHTLHRQSDDPQAMTCQELAQVTSPERLLVLRRYVEQIAGSLFVPEPGRSPADYQHLPLQHLPWQHGVPIYQAQPPNGTLLFTDPADDVAAGGDISREGAILQLPLLLAEMAHAHTASMAGLSAHAHGAWQWGVIGLSPCDMPSAWSSQSP